MSSPKETLVCLVRHGVTDWNYEGRAQGLADIPLNAEGVRQAEAVAVALMNEPWDAIYASTLSRAYTTAEAIARRTGHAQVVRDPRLVERDMGPIEGFTAAMRQARWGHTRFEEFPGVESDAAMAARAESALRELAGRHPGGRIICVAHGALIAVFLRHIHRPESGPAYSYHQRNTAITRLRFDGLAFRQVASPDHNHILVDGIEFSGEKGRLPGRILTELLPGVSPEHCVEIVSHATAVESAWDGDALVGFTRCFTDRVYSGYIDIAVTRPDFEHLQPVLIRRLEARYPEVRFTVNLLRANAPAAD